MLSIKPQIRIAQAEEPHMGLRKHTLDYGEYSFAILIKLEVQERQ